MTAIHIPAQLKVWYSVMHEKRHKATDIPMNEKCKPGHICFAGTDVVASALTPLPMHICMIFNAIKCGGMMHERKILPYQQ